MSAPVAAFSGSGPGVQTLDGCSVDFYRQLPYLGELDEILPLLPPGGEVLELGCGTGRLAGHLQERGHAVVGVDNSAEMLGHLPIGVRGVCASIETLELDRRFPVVLLPSHLINHADAALREAFVACAARHLAPGGRFLLKRFDPDWLQRLQVGPLGERAGVRYLAEAVERRGDQVHISLVYEAFGQRWTQCFVAQALDDSAIESLLAAQGLRTRWHGGQRLWAQGY